MFRGSRRKRGGGLKKQSKYIFFLFQGHPNAQKSTHVKTPVHVKILGRDSSASALKVGEELRVKYVSNNRFRWS